MKPVPIFRRFSFKIIAGMIGMLFLVGTPFFFAFLKYHRTQLLEALESSTTNMSRVLTHQLEISVLERRDHELGRVLHALAASGDVRNIILVNPSGKVVVASDPGQVGRVLGRHSEPGCRECHVSVVLKDTIPLTDSQGHEFYRNVTVIQNRPTCFPCHDPRSSINGILVMDFSQDALQGQLRAGLYRFVGLGAAMLLLTIAVLYVLLNQLVLRRLRKFAETAEQIGPGRFGRVAISGNDEFGQLANSFNLMSERLESAVREIQGTRDYLESIINNIDDEIIVLDRNFEVVTSNVAHSRAGAAQGAAQEPGERTKPGAERHDSESCVCALTFGDGQVHKTLQTAYGADGKQRFIEVFSSPLRGETGEVLQVIEVRRDITERKLLEANLAHSERLISMGVLASGLSHEINNPLASMSTFVEGLKRRLAKAENRPAPGLEGLESSLSLIQREIERARDVTRRLLVLAQKDDDARSLVDLNESLSETVLLVKPEATRRGTTIEISASPHMPTLRISESQIRQVFLNLLLNSLQAVSQDGHVRCRTWHENGRAHACVEDDGPGIDSRDQLKIFEPFFSTRPPGQGTGLGLFICKSIVSAWGGDISVESRPGEGARFTVSIPAQT